MGFLKFRLSNYSLRFSYFEFNEFCNDFYGMIYAYFYEMTCDKINVFICDMIHYLII